MLVPISKDVLAEMTALAEARVAGKRRFDQYSDWHHKMAQRGKGDSGHGHLVGVLGEWAAAKATGSRVDTRIFEDDGDNGVGDLVIPGIGWVQVKTRTRRGWDFALSGTDPNELKARMGILVWPGNTATEVAVNNFGANLLPMVDHLVFEVYGYLWREELLRYMQRIDYGLGERLMVAPHWFHKILTSAQFKADTKGGV